MQRTDERFVDHMNEMGDKLIGRIMAIGLILILLEWVTR